jgi:hypothetical protein
MSAVIRTHRLLILALVVGFAALLLAVVVFDVNHAQVAADHARSSWGHVTDLARSSWGRHVSHLHRA